MMPFKKKKKTLFLFEFNLKKEISLLKKFFFRIIQVFVTKITLLHFSK